VGKAFAYDRQTTNVKIRDVPAGTVGLGAGVRAGNTPYKGVRSVSSLLNDNEYDLIPLYLYEGKWLFFHGTTAGLHLFDNGWLKVDALAAYRFDRLETDADPYFAGLQERKQTVDAGLSMTLSGDWGEASATWVHDLQGRHNGYEQDLTYSYPWSVDRLSLSPFVSYVYQNRDLVDYYYGVSASEALPDRPAYQAGAASFWRTGINVSYQLSQRITLFSNFSFEPLDSEVRKSPLVNEKQLYAAVLGFSYWFGNALNDSSKQNGSERIAEWSWRLNAGYAADATVHKVHRGFLKRNQDAHTYIGGLTLGKLLSDGKYIDYWGRLSLNRRFENGYQSDFWEYDAYVMAMTALHSPWSHQEVLRYGFGFGLSYASSVPIIEKISQERRGRNDAHFLNYLEAQLDVPFRFCSVTEQVKIVMSVLRWYTGPVFLRTPTY
jgi:outer membrane scaffolding protein for murein synthesis (MipA/OmpV family)